MFHPGKLHLPQAAGKGTGGTVCPPQSSSRTSSSSALLPRGFPSPSILGRWLAWALQFWHSGTLLFIPVGWKCLLQSLRCLGRNHICSTMQKMRNQRSLPSGWDPLELRGSDLGHFQMQKGVMEHEAVLQQPALPPWHGQGSSVTPPVP